MVEIDLKADIERYLAYRQHEVRAHIVKKAIHRLIASAEDDVAPADEEPTPSSSSTPATAIGS